MKTEILLILLITAFILLAAIMNQSMAKTETQKFTTLFREGNFEIRYYPEAVLATVKMNGTYDDSRNSGFRMLAGYIFGGNKNNQKIAMTAPVRMTDTENTSTMSFVMPADMEFDNLPEPLNKQIMLHTTKPVYAAALRYGGYTSKREIEAKKAELAEWLVKLGFSYTSNFEYLGYNPPYQMVNRKNEVVVELFDFNPEKIQEIKAVN